MNTIASWTNNLPIGWKAAPLKSAATYYVSNVDKLSHDDEIPVELCNYTDVYKNELIHDGLEFMPATASESEIRKYQLENGDIIITKDSEAWDDIGIPAIVIKTKQNLLCGYHLAVIRADQEKFYSPFLFRCLQSKTIRLQLELASTGVTRFGLPKGEIGRMIVPIPSISFQREISNYIDIETAQIDKLIEAKTNLLISLSEKRQALITQTVTKGLNPKVKLKDSSIDWLGQIPENWKVKKIKYVANKIGSGVTPKGGAEVYQKEGVPLFRSQNIHFDGLKLDDIVYIDQEIHESMSNSKVQAGDVLLNITGASLGRCYYYEGQFEQANVNQHVCIIRPNKEILTKYLYYFLFSDLGQSQISISQVGGGREGLTFESIKAFFIPLPEIEEQHRLIKLLEESIDRINQLEKNTEMSIKLLEERKSALITEAVTGQLNIG